MRKTNKDKQNKKKVNFRLKDAYTFNNISPIDLAEKLGVCRKTISRWEKNITRPSYEQLPELSRILGVHIDFLISYKDSVFKD